MPKSWSFRTVCKIYARKIGMNKVNVALAERDEHKRRFRRLDALLNGLDAYSQGAVHLGARP
jgi:hypothetical protein